MSINEKTAEIKPISRRIFVWRALLVFFALSIATCSCLLLSFFAERSLNLAKLDLIAAKIQDNDEPLTAEELATDYAGPQDKNDLTREYYAAIQTIGSIIPTPAAAKLPIVGDVPKHRIEEKEFLEAAKTYLFRYESQLQVLRELANRDGDVRYRLNLSLGYACRISHVINVRTAGKLLELQYHVCRQTGDRAGALASLRGMIRLSETLRYEPIYASQLVRCVIFASAVECATDFLGLQEATPEELRSLDETIQKVDFHPGFLAAMIGERAMAYSLLYAKDSSDLNLDSDFNEVSRYISFCNLAKQRPGDAVHYMEFTSELVEAAKLPLPEAIQEHRAIIKRVDAQIDQERDQMSWNRHILAANRVNRMAVVGLLVGKAQSCRNALQVALALENYRLKRDKYPAELTELVPTFLPEIPSDPLDGQPMRYQLEETCFAVYSVGQDKIDGGGIVKAAKGVPLDLGIKIEFRKPQ